MPLRYAEARRAYDRKRNRVRYPYMKEYHKEWREQHQDSLREYSLQRYHRVEAWRNLEKLYGITESEYLEIAKSQNFKCAICKTETIHRLCIDHDHETGKVRGLLCHNCNLGLGHFQDSILYLESAVNYLQEY